MKQFVSFMLCLLAFSAASAQVTTSSMSGHVQDEQGAPVVGALVLATHTPSGTEYSAIVDGTGNYRIMNMRSGGPYSVKISMLGFQTVLNEGINIALGDNYVLDVTLPIESTDLDEVVVTGTRSSILNSDRAGVATNINNRQLNVLPTVSRSISDFTRLTPQAGNSGSFGGRDTRYNNVSIDGAAFAQRFGLSTSNNYPGGDAQPISLDAIQEISVNLTPFDIRQSNFTGANINAVTKSGDNSYHATAYTFQRFKSMTGDRVQDATVANAKTTSRQTYGASVGGPIIKNKLFFFINGELEYKSFLGNQWQPSTDGVGSAENKISQTTIADLERVSNSLKEKYNYDPGAYQNFGNSAADNYKIMARIDWNISKNHKLMVRYNDVKSQDDNLVSGASTPGGVRLNNAGRNSINSISFANTGYKQENRVRSITAELNSVFSPKVSNKLLASFTNINDTRKTDGDLFPFVDIMRLGSDGKTYEGYMSFGTEIFSFNNGVLNNTFNITDNVTIGLGQHTLTAGLSYENQHFSNGYMREGTTYYAYNSVDDFINNAKPAAFAYQLGYPGNEDARTKLTFGLASVYVQDEWRVNPKLRLTAGLRLEVPIFYTKLQGPTSTSINGVQTPLSEIPFENGQTVNLSQWPKSKPLFSPRVGFNWDITGDRSIQLRGGTGIFTGLLPFVWFTNQPGSAGFVQSPEVVLTGGGVPNDLRFNPNYRDQVFNNPAIFPNPPKAGETPSGSNFAKVDENFKLPQLWRTSVAADFRLPWEMVLTLEAMYSKDINAVTQRNINLPDPVGNFTGVDDRPRWNSGKLNKDVSSMMVLTNTNKGHQASLTVQLTKQFSNGLSGMIAYTYNNAKDLTANPGSVALSAWRSSASVGSLNDPGVSYSAFSMPHRVNGYISYSIDWAKNHLRSTFTLYYSGTNQGRLSYVFSNDMNGDTFGQDLIFIPRPDQTNFVDVKNKETGKVTYSAAEQQRDYEAFLNGNSYLKKRQGQYAERYGDVQPWINQFDFKFLQDIASNFGSNNRYSLQFSVDILNVGNLLNKNWGVYYTNGMQSYENFRLFTYTGQNAAGAAQYTLNASSSDNFKKNNTNENYSPLNNPLQQPVILYIRCLSVLISHDPSRLMLILIECFHVTDIKKYVFNILVVIG